MSRIAIIGAGNLGSFLAAHLALAGHDVYFCVRRPVARLRVSWLPEVAVPCHTSDPPPADIVLLAVKAYDTPEAMAWLPSLCSNGAPVAVIQNGVHHAERVAPYPAIPVLSYVYVEEQAGIHYAFAPPREHFTVPGDAVSERLAALFAGTEIQVRREAAFHAAAWRKMLHNCVSNPLTALAGRGLEILGEPLYREWARLILHESLTVANADGARLAPSEAEAILSTLASYPPGTRTSMLQDKAQGKRLELDALNGALVAMGRRYGRPTPVNEDLVARLS